MVKFINKCDASADVPIQTIDISILPADEELPNKIGNTFITQVNTNVDTSIQCAWLNDTVAVINYNSKLIVHQKNPIVGKIKVLFHAR